MKTIETPIKGDDIAMRSRFIVVLLALVIEFLMPYISRIPFAFTYGVPGIWRYIHTFNDFIAWNGLHLLTLIPIFVFGMLFIYADLKWAFCISTLTHLTVTSFLYNDLRGGSDDALGLVIFPVFILLSSGLFGALALIAEAIMQKRS